jgi:cytochrome c oxidase subunit IV
MSTEQHGSAHSEMVPHAHPGPRVYVMIAAILAVITIAEVIIYDLWQPGWLLSASLGLLSAGKFLLVIGVYMHLRFDNKMFSYMFGFGLVLAASIITALWFLFWPHPPAPIIEHGH